MRLLCLLFILISLNAQAIELSGYIFETENQSPVRDAAVELLLSGKVKSYSKTNANGYFKLKAKVEEEYTIKITKVGFDDEFLRISTKGVNAEVGYPSLEIQLEKKKLKLSGKVLNQQDQSPVAYAPLRLIDVLSKEEITYTAGVNGGYEIPLVSGTNYILRLDPERIKGKPIQAATVQFSTIGVSQAVVFSKNLLATVASSLVFAPVQELIIPEPKPKNPSAEVVKPVIIKPVEEVDKDVTSGQDKPIAKDVIVKDVTSSGLSKRQQKKLAQLEEKKAEAHSNISLETTTQAVTEIEEPKKDEYQDLLEQLDLPEGAKIVSGTETFEDDRSNELFKEEIQEDDDIPAIDPVSSMFDINEMTFPKVMEEEPKARHAVPDSFSFCYDAGKALLTDDAVIFLNQVALRLQERPKERLKIEIYSDTKHEYTIEDYITELRAESIINQLMQSGVRFNQLIIRLRGHKVLFNDCTRGVNCTDQQHQENRRAIMNFVEI